MNRGYGFWYCLIECEVMNNVYVNIYSFIKNWMICFYVMNNWFIDIKIFGY